MRKILPMILILALSFLTVLGQDKANNPHSQQDKPDLQVTLKAPKVIYVGNLVLYEITLTNKGQKPVICAIVI